MSAAKIIGIAVKTATIRELAHERPVLDTFSLFAKWFCLSGLHCCKGYFALGFMKKKLTESPSIGLHRNYIVKIIAWRSIL